MYLIAILGCFGQHHFRGQPYGNKEKYHILKYLPSIRQLHPEKSCAIITITSIGSMGVSAFIEKREHHSKYVSLQKDLE